MKFLAPLVAVILAGVSAITGFTSHTTHQQSMPSQSQQEPVVKQQFAKVDHPILLSFTPSTKTVLKNKTFTIQLSLDAHELPVTGIDLSIPLDSSIVEFVSFDDSRSLNSLLINRYDSNANIFRFSAVDTSTRKLTGRMILGTLTLKAKAAGSATIRPSKSQLTASGYDQAIPTDVMTATYTIR